MPTHLNYTYQATEAGQPDRLYFLSIDGGTKSTKGWSMESGLQVRVASNWLVALGVHYAKIDHEASW